MSHRIKNVKNRKLDLMSMHVPFYQITHLKVPTAIIINGKQLIFRKLPKNRDYFIDKDFGLFEIKPSEAFLANNTAVYIYDVRNQNPIDLGLLNELYQWANSQGLYKIRREDVYHARELNNKSLTQLTEEQNKARLETRGFMQKVLEQIDVKNKQTQERKEREAGTLEDSDEYKQISKEDARFIIVRNLFEKGYIDTSQASNLNHLLTLRQINTTDDLLNHLDSFNKIYVTKPLPHQLERILDDYHTYKPRDIITIIQSVTKLNKGLKNLRTKPVMNWFPATYLLFGALGVVIAVIVLAQYGFFNPPPAP